MLVVLVLVVEAVGTQLLHEPLVAVVVQGHRLWVYAFQLGHQTH
jgi:hypothetical protein